LSSQQLQQQLNKIAAEQIIIIDTCYSGSFIDDISSTKRTILTSSDAITNPDDTRNYLMSELSGRSYEVFGCLFLDNKNYGTIDAASVYPREVVKRALQLNAAAIILDHFVIGDGYCVSLAEKGLM
jgi:DNA repair protein RadC